jgi:hypothetical protein
MKVISSMPENTKILEYLDLNDNSIKGEGIKHISKALASNKKVTHL